jgi:nucleoid DNA-binding protein
MAMKKTREFSDRVQSILNLSTKKEAEFIIQAVIRALEQTLIDRIGSDGFSLKLGSFGKFKIHHRPSIYRKIPFTGEMKMINPKRKVKFVALGSLRALEAVTQSRRKTKAGNSHPRNRS